MFCEWDGEFRTRFSQASGVFLLAVRTFSSAGTSWASPVDAAVPARVDCLEGTLVGHIAPERVSPFLDQCRSREVIFLRRENELFGQSHSREEISCRKLKTARIPRDLQI